MEMEGRDDAGQEVRNDDGTEGKADHRCLKRVRSPIRRIQAYILKLTIIETVVTETPSQT
jgi:hypothetical protein